MSMPTIPNITPDIDLDREDSINLLLASIALEEMGLAHILNAEGEKVQYILGAEDACLNDLLAVNNSIEQVIKAVTKLQLILQDKLETVTQLIRKPDSPPHPHPPKPRPKCVVVGCAVTVVPNRNDEFYGANVILDAKEPPKEPSHRYPLTYTLFKRGKGSNVSALVVPLWDGLMLQCKNGSPSNPTPEQPNVLSMTGKAMMRVQGLGEAQYSATVSFTLEVWDYGIRHSLRMVTTGDNEVYNHDSGIMGVMQGDLEIKRLRS